MCNVSKLILANQTEQLSITAQDKSCLFNRHKRLQMCIQKSLMSTLVDNTLGLISLCMQKEANLSATSVMACAKVQSRHHNKSSFLFPV